MNEVKYRRLHTYIAQSLTRVSHMQMTLNELNQWLTTLPSQERSHQLRVAIFNLHRIGLHSSYAKGKQVCLLSESPIKACLSLSLLARQFKQLAEQHFVTGSVPKLYLDNPRPIETGTAPSKESM